MSTAPGPSPIAYLDGRLVPAREAAVPVTDAGFMLGTTVAEQLRTFGGELFRLDRHLARLARSLEIVGVTPPLGMDELGQIAQDVARHNHRLLAAGDDLGLTMFVTPGPAAALAPGAPPRPLVCVHTRPLPFAQWVELYEVGESLATTDVAQVSPRSWPPELKCRSRMHYYLADRQARERFAGARAVMTDESGCLTEATTANLLIYRRATGLVTPPKAQVLPGISLGTVVELAAELQIPLAEAPLRPADVAAADEVLLCSTSPCLVPVTRLGGQPVGGGRPGEVCGRLLAAWSRLVGLDIVAQARQFARR